MHLQYAALTFPMFANQHKITYAVNLDIMIVMENAILILNHAVTLHSLIVHTKTMPV
jgi:hypothetical protein